MRIEQLRWTAARGWQGGRLGALGDQARLVLAFAGTAVLKDGRLLEATRSAYPSAHVLACSTAGEIFGTEVSDDAFVVTAVAFEHTTVTGAAVTVRDADDSPAAGEALAAALDPRDLVYVLVISDGLAVNGSGLVRGMSARLPPHVTVTGGLSGDGARFQETLVAWDGPPAARTVAAVGFYGDRLRVGHGSLGGWDSFGPERQVTRSRGNVLYEVDGRPALALYKMYLGDHAKELPAAGLLFPLSLRTEHGGGLVRTILAVDEAQGSMTFAGDVPEGAYVRLMKANFDRLIDGAAEAARASRERLDVAPAELAILISCVGRKLVLKQRIEEEVESVRDVLGPRPVLAGFYSYGEISPFTPTARCELHNQTMTITTLSEH